MQHCFVECLIYFRKRKIKKEAPGAPNASFMKQVPARSKLAAFELRLALLHEGLHAFRHVLGLEQRQKLQIDVVHVV